MKRVFVGALALVFGAVAPASAQSLDDLNIQLHGYATQGFLYSTNNNILTTNSGSGSPEWTEAVVNISAVPTAGLRVAVQGRYELLGNYANQITLDYASADYRVKEQLGVRFGKVKVPSGLFNEIQDIDPSYQFALLPQSVYPIASRNGQLSIYGGVVYGTITLPPMLGKLEYRGWSGEISIPSNDGYFLPYREQALNLTNGVSGVLNGGAIHWKTPLAGLMIGASDDKEGNLVGAATTPYGKANLTFTHHNQPHFFARYDNSKLMVSVEYTRLEANGLFQFPGPPATPTPVDTRSEYAMVTYKVTNKFTAGAYGSEQNSHGRGVVLGPTKYSKDWTVSGRYDFNQYLYAKAEEHFIDGTALDYDAALNPAGLKPTTKLTVLKVGVSF